MTRRTLEIAAFCVALLVAAMAIHAWLTSRDEQQRLAATLAAQKQIIDSANSSERARQASLDDALAQIEKLKRDTQTPAQILAALPKYLQLPQPIALAPGPASPPEQGIVARNAHGAASSASIGATPPGLVGLGFSPDITTRPKGDTALPTAVAETRASEQQSASPVAPCDSAGNCSAQIPSADLKPLFDYVQDCRACQAQLAAAQKNSAADAAKIAALTRERDAAITASKGGSFLRRLRRNALWFAIGAAGGYIAAKH